MYATRRHYVKQWDFQTAEERHQVTVTKGGKPVDCIKPELISVVEEEVMYWRKANHIHKWFVDNVQNGVDDCGRYPVLREQLEVLLDVCKRVIENSELVPGEVYAGTVYDKDHLDGKRIGQPGQVIKDPTVATEILPTQAGFFFGSLEYDYYYLDDVVRTRDWIATMLSDPGCRCYEGIYYSSSW